MVPNIVIRKDSSVRMFRVLVLSAVACVVFSIHFFGAATILLLA